MHTTDSYVVHIADWRSIQLECAESARMDRSLDVPVTVQVEQAKGGTVLLPCIMQLHGA